MIERILQKFSGKQTRNPQSNVEVLIFVENLRLGGIQRLAMDEAYWFDSNNILVTLVTFQTAKNGASILDADGGYHKQKIEFLEAPRGWLKQLQFTYALIRRTRPKVILCHAARANLITRIIRSFSWSKFKIIGFVHQLPNLSSLIQNAKRGIYFRFADEVYAVSRQFMLEINLLRLKKLKYKLMFRKDIKFERVGLYLPRMEFLQNKSKKAICDDVMPLMFLGRMIRWKGFEKFVKIVRETEFDTSVVVFTSPEYHEDSFSLDFFSEHINRFLILGQSIASYDWKKSAIHLYPTFYTEDTVYPVSISMNVLECVALGIPSLISKENFDSYPEFRDSILCKVVDWNDKESVKEKIIDLRKTPHEVFLEEARRLRTVISIDQHCMRLKSHFLN
jgi:hypothetical protein